jgi:CelD/BcsL family acetyltransferase involved in cellulose biosynthesis
MFKGHSSALLDHGAIAATLRDRPSETAASVRALTGFWSGIAISVVSDLREVEADWRAFEKRADGTVFQTFDWLAKWQRHIGAPTGVVPAIVVGRDAGGAILFLFPLAIENGRLARRLTWLGAMLCDYNGPLLAPEFSARVSAGKFPALWQAVRRLLRGSARLRFDFVDLSKMLESVGGQRNPFIALDVHANASGAYVSTLGDDWETYYAAKRSGPTRKKERKQVKQLGEHGEVRFVDVAGSDAIVASMETLIEQKTRSFARLGVTNNFARPGYREFYLDLTTDPATRDLVHISRLDVGNAIAAASLGLRRGNDYYLILSSYQDGELARFGPGRAHLNELLRYAVSKGVKRFDFTIGDEPYKRDWSDIVLRPFDHLAAATVRGQAVVTAMVAFRGLKRTIKQTPILWQVFSKLRALKGSLSGTAKRQEEPGETE